MPLYIAWSEDLGDQPPEAWAPEWATRHDSAEEAARDYLLGRPEQIEKGAVALVSVMDDTGDVGDYFITDRGELA